MIHHETIVRDAIEKRKKVLSYPNNEIVLNFIAIPITGLIAITLFYFLDLFYDKNPSDGVATKFSLFIYKSIELTTLPADFVANTLFFFGATTFGLFYIPLLIYIAYLNINGPDDALKREAPWLTAFIKAFIFYIVYCIFADLGNLFYLVGEREVDNTIIQPTSLTNVYLTITETGMKVALILILLLLDYGIRRPFNINKG